MVRVKPGLAFSLACDLGFAVGLVTHRVPRIGDLIWLARKIFDTEPDPTMLDPIMVDDIEQWRWPVFFPTASALHRKIIFPMGIVEIPPRPRPFPLMRGGSKKMGWREVRYDADNVEHVFGVATDPTLPLYSAVNDTLLKEMLVSG